jgi:hypothetical protein
MSQSLRQVFLCCHCGNTTPHELKLDHTAELLWDELPEPCFQKFTYLAYSCGTCDGLSLLGCFELDRQDTEDNRSPPYPRLYPVGPDIDPPSHTVGGVNPVPAPVRRAYREAWHLQHTAPGAFANQIRRALEFICNSQNVKGSNLYERLEYLAKQGVFPSGLADVATLIRRAGNIGSHASEKEINRWDAELLDSLFRMILEYVYVGPARLKQLELRMKS